MQNIGGKGAGLRRSEDIVREAKRVVLRRFVDTMSMALESQCFLARLLLSLRLPDERRTKEERKEDLA